MAGSGKHSPHIPAKAEDAFLQNCYFISNLIARGLCFVRGGRVHLVIRAIMRSHCLSQRGRFLSSFVLVPALFSIVMAGVIQCIILTR